MTTQTHPLQVVFLCGARDFHAMDWYRASLGMLSSPKPIILTDLIEGEGFRKLITNEDTVHKLLILDSFLLKKQSRLGNVWRNLLKAILFPAQVILIYRFNKKFNNTLYYAHSMYYIWLGWAAGVRFIGTPQGSDILLKPQKSQIFKILSTISMKSSIYITVDSKKMADITENLTGKRPLIIQNGIDINTINNCNHFQTENSSKRNLICSFRGLTPLYRIEEIVKSRNKSLFNNDMPLTLLYPFHEDEYIGRIDEHLNKDDKKLGRLEKKEMYNIFFSTLLAISIPISDSSPRSVYEAIFCGSIVAITWHPFFDDLPKCMQERIVIVNIEDEYWFDKTIEAAKQLIVNPFIPTEDALKIFDQSQAFNKIHNMAIRAI